MNKEIEMERQKSVELTKQFAELEGRRPRMYIAEMEEDDSEEQRKLAATTFADAGWDVDVGSLETPEDTARSAVDNDVHFIYYTSDSLNRVHLLIELERTLTLLGRDDILIALHQGTESEKKNSSATAWPPSSPGTTPWNRQASPCWASSWHRLRKRSRDSC